MNQASLTQNSDLHLDGGLWILERGLWKLRSQESAVDASDNEMGRIARVSRAVRVSDTTDLTRNEVSMGTRKTQFPLTRQSALAQQSEMSLLEFVERRFVPEHVALKEVAGRTHYQAMLKHILRPEEVDRIFCANPAKPRKGLKTVPGWPYLSRVRLCDFQPEHLHCLTSEVLAEGYSIQTARHIQNVVSAIFSYARHVQCFIGDNPASLLKLPEMNRKRKDSLTLGQMREALGAMQYPEKEMTLLAAFTGMNLAEIAGLQWKRVNLSGAESIVDGMPVPPRTIAIRKQWSRGPMGSVKSGRVRNLPISQPLLDILIKLKDRSRFTGPDDFVLVSQGGKPINQNNILARRLKPIARQLGLPSVSWQVFLRTRKDLVSQFGMQFQDLAAIMVPSDSSRDEGAYRNWHCRVQRNRA